MDARAWNDPIGHLAGAMRRDRPWVAAAVLGALAAHAAVALAFPRLVVRSARPDLPTEVVDIDLPRPPPPSPPPASPLPDPVKEDPRPRTAAPPNKKAEPPSPAQAAAIVTKQEDPNDPIDLTDTFVTGTATAYAGGVTTSSGTNPNAVHGSTSPTGTPFGVRPAPTAAAPPTVDHTRGPTLAGTREWSCPFPPEADAEGIDSATVAIKVSVDASGQVKDVTVLRDPGHGFGSEARRCAFSKRWTAALDHDGASVEGIAVINVRFDR